MKRLLQMTFAVLIGWTLANNGSASAQEAAPVPRLIPVQTPVTVEVAPYTITPLDPARNCQSCDLSCQSCQGRSQLQESYLRHTQNFENGLISVMNSKGCGCMGSHTANGCMSTYAFYMFVFGSCREWFSEPCFPPPPSDRPFGRLLTLCGK